MRKKSYQKFSAEQKAEELQRDRGCIPEQLFFYPTTKGGLAGLQVAAASRPAGGTGHRLVQVPSPG